MDGIQFPAHRGPLDIHSSHGPYSPAAMGDVDYDPCLAPNQCHLLQDYGGRAQDDLNWLRNPFQSQACSCPGMQYAAPIFPAMPPYGMDPMMGGYWQGVQGMLAMQIAMLDRLIALVLLMMQNQPPYGAGGYPQPMPQPVPPCPCPEPEPDPVPAPPCPGPDPEPVPPTPEPIPDPCPPCDDDHDVAPVPPQPPQPEASRSQRLQEFERLLLQSGTASRQQVLELAQRAGLSDDEGQKLVTFLSLGRDRDQFNFAENETRNLLQIFLTAANANGDISVVAQALLRYSDNVDRLLPEECFDVLLGVAGNPPGQEVRGGAALKEQLTDADGWGLGFTLQRGCNMQEDDVRQVLESWARRSDPGPAPAPPQPAPPAPAPPPEVGPAPQPESPEQVRGQALQRFQSDLEVAGQEVSPSRVLQICQESGLSDQEGERFITFLAAGLGQDTDDSIDFTAPEARQLMAVYFQAARSNGDVRVLAQALLGFADNVDSRLSKEAYDALVYAAGKPPGSPVAGAEQLANNIGQQSDWSGSIWSSIGLASRGADLTDDGVKQVLRAMAERSTPIEGGVDEAAPINETPDQRRHRERNSRLDRFRDELLNAGDDVDRNQVIALAQRSGLDAWEGENLWNFLKVLDDSDYDFSDSKVVELVNIYFEAARGNGDVKAAVRALARYADHPETRSENLDRESFDALMMAAGDPPGQPPDGAARLARQLAPSDGDWGGIFDAGINLRDEERRNILSNWLV